MTGHGGRAQVGIVSDIVLQRHRLQAAAAKFGLDVCFSGDPERLQNHPDFPEAGLWLVTLEDEADHPALFDYLLDNTEAPVLFGLDQAPSSGTTNYFRWERRLLGKLEQQLGDLAQLDSKASIEELEVRVPESPVDRKSTRLNSSHVRISYAVFCLKKKNRGTVGLQLRPRP